MTACDDYIKQMGMALPKMCHINDLVKVGLFANPQGARSARLSNRFPEHFRIGKRIVIPRESVIEWLKRSKIGERHANTSKTARFDQGATIEASYGQDGVA